MKQLGIQNICIVSGREHVGDFVELLGSGKEFEVDLTYRVQEAADGIAGALMLTEDFAKAGDTHRLFVLLGDNLFSDTAFDALVGAIQYRTHAAGSEPLLDRTAHIFLSETDTPERFGCACFEDDKLVYIVEKPVSPYPSNWAVTGAYLYGTDHLYDMLASLKPSARGELEITDVNDRYIEEALCYYTKLPGWWMDAGTFETYQRANTLLKDYTYEH